MRKLPNVLKQQKLTKKQQIILYLLYQFRFLNTSHIRQLLKHKHPSRVQAWMKYLTKKGYVIQFYDRHTLSENTKPAVYCLATKARYALKAQKGCELVILNRLYREKNCSKKFQAHCLFFASYYLQLRDKYEAIGKTLHYFTQVELVGYNHFPQPLPDGYFAIKDKRIETQRYFVELFDEGTPRFALRQRIRRYVSCAEDSEWEEQTHVAFPIIIFICATKQMQKYVEKFTQNLLYEAYVELSFEVQKSSK